MYIYLFCEIIMSKQKFKFENVSFEIFFQSLAISKNFRNEIINLFGSSQFEQIYWEFPGLNYSNRNQIAEFMFIDAYPFSKSDPSSFMQYFVGKKYEEIVKFKNISEDTDLICPCPGNNNNFNDSCSDIMNFMKNASYNSKHKLLEFIGIEMSNNLQSNKKKYLSTHGKGVNWLHVRICDKNKYYTGGYQ